MILWGITWASAHLFWWLLGGLTLTTATIVYQLYQQQYLINYLTVTRWTSLLIPHYSLKKTYIKTGLIIIAATTIMLALLQPQWGTKEQKTQQEGRELFIALDISRSMLAADVKPNRLEFAKAKIQHLLQLLPADRVGLLVFSGSAVMQCPLTRDKALFNMFLKNLDAQTISSGTTALDQAIAKVVSVLAKLPARKHKLLIIFTDGEDFSHNLSRVKEEAQKIGLIIFTYGVGTAQGAPIPIINDNGKITGYEKNEQGNVVLSKLNIPMLQALSRETGAHYIAPTQSNQDLETIVTEVNTYEKEQFDDKQLSRQEDQYSYFLFIAFICLLIGWLL